MVGLAAWPLIGFTGCAFATSLLPDFGPGKCESVEIEIRVKADETLNLSLEGQSTPVEVRTYLLKSLDDFEQLDAEALAEESELDLGDSLVLLGSMTAFPGEEALKTFRGADVAYVALVPFYRRPDLSSWKQIVDIREQALGCRMGDPEIPICAHLHDSAIFSKPCEQREPS